MRAGLKGGLKLRVPVGLGLVGRDLLVLLLQFNQRFVLHLKKSFGDFIPGKGRAQLASTTNNEGPMFKTFF